MISMLRVDTVVLKCSDRPGIGMMGLVFRWGAVSGSKGRVCHLLGVNILINMCSILCYIGIIYCTVGRVLGLIHNLL